MKHARRNTAGFTLAEMLMATAISAIVLGGITTTYLMSIKGFVAMSNYAQIHADGRIAVDRFARDIRAVYSITSCSSSNLVVVVPTAFSSSGGVLSNKTVTYSVSAGALYRADSATGSKDMLATNIYQLTFSLYDKVGNATAVLSTAKGVQLDIKLRKYTMSQAQSEDFLSARLDMRNKP